MFGEVAHFLFGGGLGIVGHVATSILGAVLKSKTGDSQAASEEADAAARVATAGVPTIGGVTADAKDSRWLVAAQAARELAYPLVTIALAVVVIALVFVEVPDDGTQGAAAQTVMAALGTSLTWNLAARKSL